MWVTLWSHQTDPHPDPEYSCTLPPCRRLLFTVHAAQSICASTAFSSGPMQSATNQVHRRHQCMYNRTCIPTLRVQQTCPNKTKKCGSSETVLASLQHLGQVGAVAFLIVITFGPGLILGYTGIHYQVYHHVTHPHKWPPNHTTNTPLLHCLIAYHIRYWWVVQGGVVCQSTELTNMDLDVLKNSASHADQCSAIR